MCQDWGVSFQKGMHFHLKAGRSVLLMSRRPNAPYRDRIEDGGRTLVYEGHDLPKYRNGPNPKRIDQPGVNPGGTATQNGLFAEAAKAYKAGNQVPEVVYVYEKILAGIWAFNGVFHLVDAIMESDGTRRVFKFKLTLAAEGELRVDDQEDLEHNRLIPSAVKLEVWKRDKGQCVLCEARENLHFDHIIPFSKGGTSLTAKNIQLMCARHNLQKHDSIE